jgi:hypothetical protein
MDGFIALVPEAAGARREIGFALPRIPACHNFVPEYQPVELRAAASRALSRPLAALQNICRFGGLLRFASIDRFYRAGRRDVDLALKLDVLAVLAVFAFVGAILLGAF